MTKIVVWTLPRSGSKFIQNNITNYLVAKYGYENVAKAIHPGENNEDGICSFGELLLPEDLEKFELSEETNNNLFFLKRRHNIEKHGKIDEHGIHGSSVDIEGEIAKRVNFYKTFDKHGVIKEFFKYQPEMDIFNYSDKVIKLIRNKKDVIMSLMVTRRTRHYVGNRALFDSIEKFKDHKVELPKEEFEALEKLWEDFVYAPNIHPNTTVVFFEDLIKVKTSDEFCKLLGLEEGVKFNISTNYNGGYGVEYGSNKYEMVSNPELFS